VDALGFPRRIEMLATDLDGTVIGGVQEFPLYAEFRRELARLQETCGTVWIACTGRALSSFKEFMQPLSRMGVEPDYAIVRHAYIFVRSRIGWYPHVLWNLHILYHLWLDRRATEEALIAWHRTIVACAAGVRTLRLNRERRTLQFDSPESAASAVEMLRRDFPKCRHIQVSEQGPQLDVRIVPFTKGLAVAELGRRLRIGREGILTIGNGHNDISMLDPSVAAMTGCPVNSELEVMECVSRAKGHVADKPSLSGVLQVLDAYRTGVVSSVIPVDRAGASRRDGFPLRRKHTPRHHYPPFRVVALLTVVMYTVLLVFASFGLLPYSHIIMRPYNLALRLVEKAVSLVWGG
jgi:hydroxymethylpyrimidine pyrophosphatase-like HAD family hydrolase